MTNYVVLQWYYNDRDGRAILPELTATFGPFANLDLAKEWIKTASDWGGWGEYKYEVKPLQRIE